MMAGITTIIAVVALFIGIITIWLVTETVNKIEKRTQKMIEIHIKSLRETVTGLGKMVKDMKTDQEDIRNRVRDVVRNREAADVEISSLRKEIETITRALDQAGKKSGKKSGSVTSRSARM